AAGIVRHEHQKRVARNPQKEVAEAVAGKLPAEGVAVVGVGAEVGVGAHPPEVGARLDRVRAPGPGDAVVPLEAVDGQVPRLSFPKAADTGGTEADAVDETC